MLQNAGAIGLNASTSHDNTRFFVSLPTNALELWFALESERFQVQHGDVLAYFISSFRWSRLPADTGNPSTGSCSVCHGAGRAGQSASAANM